MRLNLKKMLKKRTLSLGFKVTGYYKKSVFLDLKFCFLKHQSLTIWASWRDDGVRKFWAPKTPKLGVRKFRPILSKWPLLGKLKRGSKKRGSDFFRKYFKIFPPPHIVNNRSLNEEVQLQFSESPPTIWLQVQI